MKERELRALGQMYHPFKVENSTFNQARKACKEFNESEPWEDTSAFEKLKKIFGKASDTMVLTPYFYCDHGENLYFGKNFYANTGLIILDAAKVVFGDNVFIGPNVNIYTAIHPIDKVIRATEVEVAAPVTIGDDVWIGGSVVINPGVTIGTGTVIGSGSVVTKDIPENVVAVGNPCRVLRKITKEDEKYWQDQYDLYLERTKESE